MTNPYFPGFHIPDKALKKVSSHTGARITIPMTSRMPCRPRDPAACGFMQSYPVIQQNPDAFGYIVRKDPQLTPEKMLMILFFAVVF